MNMPHIQSASPEGQGHAVTPTEEGVYEGTYFRVKDMSVSLTPTGEQAWRNISQLTYNVSRVVVNVFQILNGMVRSTDSGVSWSKHVFRFLDRARIFAFGYVPFGIYNIVTLSRGKEPLEAKVTKIASMISEIYQSLVMGIWGVCSWMGKLDQALPWLSPLIGVGCIFRLGEIAHANWEKGRIVDIKMTLEEKWKEDPYRYAFNDVGFKDLLSAFTDDELIAFFLIPENKIKKVRSDAKELVANDDKGNEKIYEFLKNKVEIKEKQIRQEILNSTISFIAGALFLATLFTPLGPAMDAVIGIAYGLFVVSGVLGLVHWHKNWSAEQLDLPKPIFEPIPLDDFSGEVESG